MLTQLTRLLISRHKDIRLVSPLLWQTDVSPALFPLPRSFRLSHCSPCFSIQDNNPWARALYEGLGYAAWGFSCNPSKSALPLRLLACSADVVRANAIQVAIDRRL